MMLYMQFIIWMTQNLDLMRFVLIVHAWSLNVCLAFLFHFALGRGMHFLSNFSKCAVTCIFEMCCLIPELLKAYQLVVINLKAVSM